ncbi:hemolysin III family protein, partial [Cytobacillus oceanisediminis]|uniref:hemolysin III family protein n=1 Tax=Cytobacillus oceanisediminis TaxID=665099 RepID=UPI001C92CAF4
AALLTLLINASITTTSPILITSLTIFPLTMIFLYTPSPTYHILITTHTIIPFLPKIHHSIIFLLIPPTYPPFSLITLNPPTPSTLFRIITFPPV